jgi:MinD-like ATPase involved in chromosome partitioning or flagellar assembly
MDAYDTKKITKNFKYEGDFSVIENWVLDQREKLDTTELTEKDIEFFETIKSKYIIKK